MHLPIARRSVWLVAVVALMASVLGPVGASAHSANNCASNAFCAYKDANYGSRQVSSTTTTNNALIDVANNVVSSGQNHTSAYYCGIEAEGWPDQTVFIWGSTQHTDYVGSSANDIIDHFTVRSGGNTCD